MSGSRHSPEDSFSFKLSGLRERTVFVLGIFPPQYSPSSPFSCGTVRRRRMNAFLENAVKTAVLIDISSYQQDVFARSAPHFWPGDS
jgi:hypothetical protein